MSDQYLMRVVIDDNTFYCRVILRDDGLIEDHLMYTVYESGEVYKEKVHKDLAFEPKEWIKAYTSDDEIQILCGEDDLFLELM